MKVCCSMKQIILRGKLPSWNSLSCPWATQSNNLNYLYVKLWICGLSWLSWYMPCIFAMQILHFIGLQKLAIYFVSVLQTQLPLIQIPTLISWWQDTATWPQLPVILQRQRQSKKNIARVQNCPDVTISNTLFGLCLFTAVLSRNIGWEQFNGKTISTLFCKQ